MIHIILALNSAIHTEIMLGRDQGAISSDYIFSVILVSKKNNTAKHMPKDT